MLGDSGVGKSSFLCQFTDHRFIPQPLTIGVDYGSVVQNIDDCETKFMVWDTAGQENFRSIIRSYFRGVMGALVVYDITAPVSFDSVEMWVDSVRHQNHPDTPITLVGNKTDLDTERKITTEQGQQLADRLQLTFVETNAKNHTEVTRVFNNLGRQIRKAAVPQPKPTRLVPMSINITQKPVYHRCCSSN